MPKPTMPTVSLAKTAPKTADVLVLGLSAAGDAPALVGAEPGTAATGGTPAKTAKGSTLAEQAASLGAKTKLGATLPMLVDGRRVVLVGLGDGDATPEQVRKAAGAAVRAAGALGGGKPVAVAIDLECDDPEMVQGVAEGALLGSHACLKITGEKPEPALASVTVVSNATGKDATAAIERAQITAENVCLARDWVNTPANLLYPESFAADAKAVAGAKIGVEVLDEKALERDGFGGILAVGGGSSRPPRLVRYSYAPKGAAFHLALVGKGITFDTGGLNLKPADGMYTMKCDMSGAAHVLAATRAIAQLGLKVKVTAYAAMAENMPSGSAYRPSDVLTMYGGKTVENANSDAEGRLVMADALVRACEDEPDLVLDMATLTGACVVALGEHVAGLMTTDDQTADVVLDAAEAAGEQFWQLPVPEEIRDGLDSKVADIKSSGSRMGGALAAAAFLQSFVADDIPHAHLDIAGTAWNGGSPRGHEVEGGTGHGVRTLIALAEALQEA